MPGELKTYRKKRYFGKTPEPAGGPTGRSFIEVRKKLRKIKIPGPEFVKPMLATLTDKAFSKEDWVFETKFDGQRCLAFRSGGNVKLVSRNRIGLNGNYPELVEAMLAQPAQDFIADGEVVALRDGLPSFEKLQPRMQITKPAEALGSGIEVFYYLFDLIYLDGYELTRLGLTLRKDILRQTFAFEDPIRYAGHVEAAGEDFFREACRKGFEGIIAKRADSAYQPGRSRDWLKFKCGRGQEFVIGGFTDPGGARTGFGALLLGYYDKGKLVYAGKVGTGFSDFLLKALGAKLKSIRRNTAPFAPHPQLREKGVHWVKPELVCEVEFSEWTSGGLLRISRFKGIRTDKDPREVVREERTGNARQG